jgi:lipopolysaccharide export system protein LptC
MIKPESRIYLDHGQHVQVRSEKGHYDQLSQRFEYQGHVELQGQDGTKLETSVASINFKTNQAEGKAPVSGRGPTGTLKGEGFKILNEGKEIHLLGKSKLTIQPNDYQ